MFVLFVSLSMGSQQDSGSLPQIQTVVFLWCHFTFRYRDHFSHPYQLPRLPKQSEETTNQDSPDCSPRIPTRWSSQDQLKTRKRSCLATAGVLCYSSPRTHLYFEIVWPYQRLQDCTRPGIDRYGCHQHARNILQCISGNWVVFPFCDKVDVGCPYTAGWYRDRHCCHSCLVCVDGRILLDPHVWSRC